MNPETRFGNGNGNGAAGFHDFDGFIRDREDDPALGWSERGEPYSEFSGNGERTGGANPDRGLVEAVVRLLDGIGSIAGDALSADLRQLIERTLRDLLLLLREVIDAIIERIDGRRGEDFRVEEIPID